jgi:hypothetical protein
MKRSLRICMVLLFEALRGEGAVGVSGVQIQPGADESNYSEQYGAWRSAFTVYRHGMRNGEPRVSH